MNESEILIIGVNYNTYPETLRYLESITPPPQGKITLVLADNSSSPAQEDFRDKIARYSFIKYLKTEKNLGYFGGARAGLQHYMAGRKSFPEWVLVTNVDVCFSAGFFARLTGMKAWENLGIIAPAILSEKWGTDYNPKIETRYSLKKVRMYRVLYSNFLIQNAFLAGAYLKKWIQGKRMPENDRNGNREKRKIYAPHGSCMIFRKSYFEKGGTLDLPNFLFGEEIYVAETCRKKGLDVIYDPGLVIRDHEHASVGFFVSPRMNRYFRESIRNVMEYYK